MKKSDKQLYLLLPPALLCTLLLFVGGPDYCSLRSIRYAWGIGHLLCFGLWSLVYSLWRGDRSFLRLVMEVIILTFFFGGLTELLQTGIGREASWQDLGNDMLGSLTAICFFSDGRKRPARPRLWLWQAPVGVALLWALIPTAKVMVDDLAAWSQFPLLAGFESPLEVGRWQGSARRRISRQVQYSGLAALEVTLSTQHYSGLGLRNFPRDWTGYRLLQLQVHNPQENPLTLHFRIHDQHHNNQHSDRYNQTFQLQPGWNKLQISLDDVLRGPRTRPLDLSRVAGMGVFVGKLARPRTIYLDEVKLLP